MLLLVPTNTFTGNLVTFMKFGEVHELSMGGWNNELA